MRVSLNSQIFLGALIGVGLGLSFAQIGVETPAVKQAIYGFSLLGTLFIDLLKMVLVPLVFTSIAVGVANLRLHSQLHRVWLFTLGFFVLSMALAIALGLSAANLFEPGKGLSLDLFHNASQNFAAKQMSFA